VAGLGPGMEGGHELGLVDQPRLERQQAEEEVARGVHRTRHDRQLPSRWSLANAPGEVPHRLPRREVAARGWHCNDVPAGWVGSALPKADSRPGTDGTTVARATRGRSPPRCSRDG